MLLLRNCRFIPELTEDTDLVCGDVQIVDQKITAILPCGTQVDGDYAELDLQGKTLMPGLIDMHLHLRHYKDLTPVAPCDIAYNVLCYANFMLDNGYTTLRDCGDHKSTPAAALRRAIQAGKFVGPNIYTSGMTIMPTETGGELPWARENHIYADSAQQMRYDVRYVIMEGADFVKLYGSGSMMVEGAQPGNRIMETDEMEAAVKAAAMKSTYCAIHMHGAEGCDTAARVGIRTIEHASFITEDTLRYLDGKEDQGIVITAAIFGSIGDSPMAKRRMEESFACLRKVKNYNVLVGWGTDISLHDYMADPYLEFKFRKEQLGFSNSEILKQVTMNSAKLMMQDHLFGSVKVGKLADLIVVDGDPVEDLTIMYQKPVHVIKSGKIIR